MKQASALVTKDCSKPLCIKCNQKMVLKENWNIQNVNVCHTLYGRRFENLQLCANCYQCVLLVQFGLPSSNQSEEAKMLMLCWTGEWTWKSDLVQETANSLKIWMTWQQIETKIRWVVVGHKHLPRSIPDSPHYQSHLFFSFHLKRRKKKYIWWQSQVMTARIPWHYKTKCSSRAFRSVLFSHYFRYNKWAAVVPL